MDRRDLEFLDGENLDGDLFDPAQPLDGMNSFDPKGGIVDQYGNPKTRGIFNSKKGKEGIITLRMKNLTGLQRKIELFNNLKSITKIPNASQYSGYGDYVPVSSGYLAAIAGTLGSYTITEFTSKNEWLFTSFAVFNDFDGSLCYVSGAVFSDPVRRANIEAVLEAGEAINWTLYAEAYVSCSQLPYRQLVDAFQGMVWRVAQTKLQTSSENQIKNAFNFVYYSPFGGVKNNSFEPSEFFQPENQQTKLINIPLKYEIDVNTAVYIVLEPNEDAQITLRVEAYRNNVIEWQGK